MMKTKVSCYHAVRMHKQLGLAGHFKTPCCYLNHPSYVTEATDAQLTQLNFISRVHLLAGFRCEQTVKQKLCSVSS